MGKIKTIALNTEKAVCYAAIVLMALLPVVDVFLRPLNLGIPFSRSFMIRLFLVTGLFAAMQSTRTKGHIAIAIVQFSKNEGLKSTLASISSLISAVMAARLFWDSLSFLRYSMGGRTVGPIPELVFALALPIAFGIMALRFALYAAEGMGERLRALKIALPPLILIAGSLIALPAITKLIWGFEPPEPFFSWVNSLYDFTFHAKIPLILFLVAAALGGTPIFIAIGGIALVLLQAAGNEPEVVPIQVFSALTGQDLIAIPLFTLTGFFLSESRAGERLVRTFRSLFSWIPGGMIIATVVICAFFTSFTGASGVTILALGGILYSILSEKLGYSERFSIGLLCSVGCIGLLFPPSLPIILIGATTNSILFFIGEQIDYSIIDFFLGAIIPGIIMVLSRILFGIFISKKVKIPVEPFVFKEACSSVKGSIFEILLPLILIGGYFTDLLSLVEVSAVSVVYIFIVEVFVNKDIALKDVPKVLIKAVPIIGGILAILAMASSLSYAIVDYQVPSNFAYWMRNNVESRIVFLLLLNLALLVVGCLMDIFSAILIVLPLIVPLGQIYGIDPIHLGIIFIVNLELGFIPPPVGMNLFLASYRFNKPFTEVCRNVMPFLAIQLVVVALVTYVPWLSTFLVGVFK